MRQANCSRWACQELWKSWRSNRSHYRPWRGAFSGPSLRKCSQSTTDQPQARKLSGQAESLGTCTRASQPHAYKSWLEGRKLLQDRNLQALWGFLPCWPASSMVSNLYGKCGAGAGRWGPEGFGTGNSAPGSSPVACFHAFSCTSSDRIPHTQRPSTAAPTSKWSP